MRPNRRPSFVFWPGSCAVLALVAGCGGGSDGTVAAPSTTVTGSVVKGPVAGASVCAYKLAAGAKGESLQCVTTGSSGSYSMELAYSGDVVVESSGGNYLDEATEATVPASQPMRVVLHVDGGSAVGMVTPLTTVAYNIAAAGQGGVSASNFSAAATNVATQFQLGAVNIVSTAPVVTGTANAYGMTLRAVSKFVANGNSLATFLAFADPAGFQSAFATAYASINGTRVTFTFTGAGPGGSAGGGTANTGGAGGTAGGGQSCGITVAGTGTVGVNGSNLPFSLPPTKICVSGVAASACAAGNSQLQSLAAGGATPSGNYSINYTYSYAPNDCAGAVATVAYQ